MKNLWQKLMQKIDRNPRVWFGIAVGASAALILFIVCYTTLFAAYQEMLFNQAKGFVVSAKPVIKAIIPVLEKFAE